MLARARSDTIGAAHSVKFVGGVAALDALLGGTGTLIAAKSGATTAETVAAGVAGAVGGIVVALLGVFLIRLVAAPFAQRREAREARREAAKETIEARAEGQRQLDEAEAECERRLVAAREDAERRLREAAAEAAERVERVETERDAALQRIEELEAPEDDPDPRIALANRAEHRAARLRAIYRKREARMGGYSLGTIGEKERAAANALGEALKDYEEEESIEARSLFDQLSAEHVMSPAHRRYVEEPQLLDDLRTAAGHFQEAAKQLRERAAQEPAEVDRVQLARAAYDEGTDVMERNVWGEGAPRKHEDVVRANQEAWKRVIDWARDTYVILKHFPPSWQRRFYGDESTREFGMHGIWLVIEAERSAGASPNDSMKRRLGVLEELLEEFDRP